MPRFRLNLKPIDYIFIGLVIFLFLLSAVSLRGNNFPFTIDQGRDMLFVRQIAIGLRPILVGPTTSINGVFLGPFWYYFNLPAFILGSGSPAALVYWQLLWFHISALFFFFLARRVSPIFAFLAGILFLTTPDFFYGTRFSWNASSMPFFSLIFFTLLVQTKLNPTKLKLFLLGVLIGLSFQIEAAFAILLLPFSVFILKRKLSLQKISQLLSGFSLTLIPQIIFELRHQFIMSKTFFAELLGRSDILGQKISFKEILSDRITKYLSLLDRSLALNHPWPEIILLSSLLLLASLSIVHKSSLKKQAYALYSLSFLLFSFIFYLFYPHKLKTWFISSLALNYIFIISSAVSHLWQQRNKLFAVIFSAFLFLSFSRQSFIAYDHAINFNRPSNDRSKLKNELAVIDWIYNDAQGKPFKVYNYLPSVYDFPYQYLFDWYADKKYNYQPDTVTYLDNVPEYIKDNKKYYNKRKPISDKNYLVYLLIEKDTDNPQREQNWLANFQDLCLKQIQTFPWTSYVQVRYPCSK